MLTQQEINNLPVEELVKLGINLKDVIITPSGECKVVQLENPFYTFLQASDRFAPLCSLSDLRQKYIDSKEETRVRLKVVGLSDPNAGTLILDSITSIIEKIDHVLAEEQKILMEEYRTFQKNLKQHEKKTVQEKTESGTCKHRKSKAQG